MEVALPHTPHHEWKFLNRVWHHKGVFFMSQITHADGVSVMQSVLSRDVSVSIASNMVFPLEQPTPSNFEV
jgi:hypothetical protein